jgi:hypothetical protein
MTSYTGRLHFQRTEISWAFHIQCEVTSKWPQPMLIIKGKRPVRIVLFDTSSDIQSHNIQYSLLLYSHSETRYALVLNSRECMKCSIDTFTRTCICIQAHFRYRLLIPNNILWTTNIHSPNFFTQIRQCVHINPYFHGGSMTIYINMIKLIETSR